MTLQEVQRALCNKPNSQTRHHDAVATMSDTCYDLIQLSQLKDAPENIKFCPVSSQNAVYAADGHLYPNLEEALGTAEYKLAEYYIDASGLYLVYMPCSEELMQTAQQRLGAIPKYIDDEATARSLIAAELRAVYCRAVRLSGDFTAYLDLGEKADYIEAHVNAKGNQIISVTTVSRQHRLRRITYNRGSTKTTVTYYC